MDKPIFVNKATEIDADFMNLVADVVFGPLNQATTVPGVLAALGIGTIAAQAASAVAVTGGTLDAVAIGNTTRATGKFNTLFNYGTPSDPNHAANKAYVDAQIAGAGLNPQYVSLNYLKLIGGVLTGPLVLVGDPTSALQAATKQYVDTKVAGFVTTDSLNNALSDIASETYVNALVAQQAGRQVYHESRTMTGTTNVIQLQEQPSGDIMVWVNGVPASRSQVSTGNKQAILTFNPNGQVEVMYFSQTGTGPSFTGLLLLSGGTMTGPLMLARDPIQPLEAATKEYVDNHAGGGGTGMYLVTGTPPQNLGVVGSVAMDPAAGNVYGPKTTTWPAPQTINAGLNASALQTLNTAVTAAQTAAAAAQTAAASVKATTTLSTNLTVAATAGAIASAALGTGLTVGLICLQLKSNVTAGTAQNYILELFDGDPTAGGVNVYQATGITMTNFSDTALFFIPKLNSGSLFARITNIDPDAMTVAVSLTFMSASV